MGLGDQGRRGVDGEELTALKTLGERSQRVRSPSASDHAAILASDHHR